jgi:hypothetical protein
MQHYYLRDLPDKVRDSVLRDFARILQGFPLWALEEAKTIWLSDDNPKHRQKPVPGDIQALARRIMQPVEAAKQRLSEQEARSRVSASAIPQRQGADEAGLHALIDEARAHSKETLAICLGRARLVGGRLDCGPSRMGEQGFARWYLGNHAAELLAMARDLGVTLRREVVA